MKWTGAKSRKRSRPCTWSRISSRCSGATWSHLLTAITSARPRSATMPRSVASCSATVLLRVQHANHDVRLIDRLQGLDDAPLLEAVVHACAAAHAGRVDQHVGLAVALEGHVHRVARRARLVERDHALLAEQAVDQRRLADIRPADHADPDRALAFPFGVAGRRLDARPACGPAGRRCPGDALPRSPAARRGRMP